MSKKTQTTKSVKESTGFFANFKKIRWGKVFGKDSEVFPLYFKVLLFTIVITGLLYGFNYLINYVWGKF